MHIMSNDLENIQVSFYQIPHNAYFSVQMYGALHMTFVILYLY